MYFAAFQWPFQSIYEDNRALLSILEGYMKKRLLRCSGVGIEKVWDDNAPMIFYFGSR
jgi:hypothetical protein